jgi:hypothetical protein
MMSIFQQTWLERARSTSDRIPLMQRLWREAVAFQSEVRVQLPGLTSFHHALEVRGDVEVQSRLASCPCCSEKSS